jgi:hypothetical protein
MCTATGTKIFGQPVASVRSSVQCFKNLLYLQLFQYYPHTDAQVYDSNHAGAPISPSSANKPNNMWDKSLMQASIIFSCATGHK